MNHIPSIIALAGIGDAPILFLLLPLAIFPFHIAMALGFGPEIMGHTTAATLIQIFLLATFIASPFVVSALKRTGFSLKALYWLAGYPVVMLSTNFLPYWFTRN